MCSLGMLQVFKNESMSSVDAARFVAICEELVESGVGHMCDVVQLHIDHAELGSPLPTPEVMCLATTPASKHGLSKRATRMARAASVISAAPPALNYDGNVNVNGNKDKGVRKARRRTAAKQATCDAVRTTRAQLYLRNGFKFGRR